MEQLDRLIHEPVRLRALTLLSGVEEAEFSFLLKALRLSSGNLSIHMRKLEQAGYLSVTKKFVGRVPRTAFSITPAGRNALRRHWRTLDDMRAESEMRQGRSSITAKAPSLPKRKRHPSLGRTPSG